MTTDLSILALISQATLLVKLIMLLLLVASIVSWTFIFQRAFSLKKADNSVDEFEQTFWSGIELGKLYTRLSAQRDSLLGLENVFVLGFKEFVRLHKANPSHPDAIVSGVERILKIAVHKETEQLETNISFLATVGSVSPYIGLFGTVWGIMNSLRALGSVQQATLAQVAPGISEALVATAIGLFAAIPAVIAYNRFTNHVQKLGNRYAIFAEEFMSILHRQAYNKVSTSQLSETTEHNL
ncbi:MAG: tolQ protein [Francisellaceae bacterium]|nr:tolQ protein [Francisellaceae bacterium]